MDKKNETSGSIGFRDQIHSGLSGIPDEEDLGCESYMLKPSAVRKIWNNSRVKNAMFVFMQDYFKPRTAYEPERIEYNALNILAEYQVYNLEFAKNELVLNDNQTALVLDIFWTLLEFDPDKAAQEVSMPTNEGGTASPGSPDQHQQSLGGGRGADQIQYLGDDIQTQEDYAFGLLLKRKFDLLKELIVKSTQRGDSSMLTVVHARKLAKYAHHTYFRHLRLYDFVLKNTKSSENKRITIPKSEPSCGPTIEQAIVLDDKVTQIWYEPDEEQLVAGSEAARSTASLNKARKRAEDEIQEKENQLEDSEEHTASKEAASSATDTDMDAELKVSCLSKHAKNVVNRSVKKWDSVISSELLKESDLLEKALLDPKARKK